MDHGDGSLKSTVSLEGVAFEKGKEEGVEAELGRKGKKRGGWFWLSKTRELLPSHLSMAPTSLCWMHFHQVVPMGGDGRR